jgi:hypothetical protein
MATQPQQVETSFYIVVTPEWSQHVKDDAGRPILTGIKAERITKGRPDVIRGGGVATKIGLVIDAGAFVPLQPEAVIHIGATEVEVIHEVTATNPDDDDTDDGPTP